MFPSPSINDTYGHVELPLDWLFVVGNLISACMKSGIFLSFCEALVQVLGHCVKFLLLQGLRHKILDCNS